MGCGDRSVTFIEQHPKNQVTSRCCSIQAHDLERTRGSKEMEHVPFCHLRTDVHTNRNVDAHMYWSASVTASCACVNAVSPNEFVAPPNAFRQFLVPFYVLR